MSKHPRKSRQRVHTPGVRTHPPQQPASVDYPMTQEEIDFYEAMKSLAANSLTAAEDALRKEGASQQAIDFLRDAMRTVCLAEIWEMHLEGIVLRHAESEGESPALRDAITEKLLAGTVVDLY